MKRPVGSSFVCFKRYIENELYRKMSFLFLLPSSFKREKRERKKDNKQNKNNQKRKRSKYGKNINLKKETEFININKHPALAQW